MRRIVRQLVAATLALAMLPAMAQTSRADVFDLVTGSWGRIDDDALSCETNPHRIRFQADRSRSKFTWEQPIVSYEGTMAISGNYTVLEHGADFLVMTLDGESRRTPAGEPVTWILRILDGGARYCWNRPDWAPDACNDRYIRCPAPAPVS